jgi:hypothetical protein
VSESLLVLGKENVPADVGAEPFGAEASRQTAHTVVGLEHLHVAAEKVSGEEAGDPSTEYTDVVHRPASY